MLTLGIDEVGRGSWAGPLVIGAVILNSPIKGLTDSKMLTKKQRQDLIGLIKAKCLDFSLSWVWPSQIDQLGLTEATKLGIKKAISKIEQPYNEIILDGKYNYINDLPNVRCLIGADKLIPSVSAASILAKVERDKYMTKQAKKYLNYGFENHVGYGTKYHLNALKKYGICEIHRLSFKPIKNIILNNDT
ncbi:MAG TPA: ribonuclease HII [Patescibacteria group bacterium]|nr:ribonuclease HII [Patescibacteria group bacterium]